MSEKDNNKQEENIYFNLKKVPLKSERKERRRKFLIGFGLVLCLALGIVTGIFIRNIIHPSKEADVNNIFGEIESILESKWLYANEYDDLQTTLEDNAFYGMTSFDDDPYTVFMSKEELDYFASSINMDYVGIGIQYSMQDDVCITNRVFLNSPAEAAGMQAGDIFTHINGESVIGLSTTEIKERVIGVEGIVVTLTIQRDGKTFDIDIIRGAVDSSIYCYALDNYLVIELDSFGNSTGKDMMAYLDAYSNIKNIIVDVRDNSGGYQSSVSEIAGLFIGDNKTYLIQTNNKGESTEAKTSCSKTFDFDNIVILVNENTASAAEVFAICLQEQLDNVTVLGTQTYGKGVIQSTRTLSNGAALKFTSYYWYSPNGTSIHQVGITPDIEIKLHPINYESYIYMEDDEKYELDSVSDINRLVQLCLDYLDYDIARTDGYFDQSLANAILKFKQEYNLGYDSILDKVTYETIMSHANFSLSLGYKDYQMEKAVELVKG